MKNINKKKEQIRKQFLSGRKNLDAGQREMFSKKILTHLVEWEIYQQSETVHCFKTIPENGEVETAAMIERLKTDQKRVVLPKSVPETKQLEHYIFDSETQLEINALGIQEPAGGEQIGPDELDLILVPMVAADLRKNRLGYGLGYYDRFLAKTDAVKAGLLFACCMYDGILPTDEHDVRLDYLITEKGVF